MTQCRHTKQTLGGVFVFYLLVVEDILHKQYTADRNSSNKNQKKAKAQWLLPIVADVQNERFQKCLAQRPLSSRKLPLKCYDSDY